MVESPHGHSSSFPVTEVVDASVGFREGFLILVIDDFIITIVTLQTSLTPGNTPGLGDGERIEQSEVV